MPCARSCVLSYSHYASKETQDRWRTRQLDQTTELDFPWIQNGVAGRHSARMG